MSLSLRIDPADNVAVALQDCAPGTVLEGTPLIEPVPAGHKFALRPIATGEAIVKYGAPIGHATRPIRPGEHVHDHNCATNLAAPAKGKGKAKGSPPISHPSSPRPGGRGQIAGCGSMAKRSFAIEPHPAFVPLSPDGERGSGDRGDLLTLTLSLTFRGYRRGDGRVGIRNELWIVPTVGCINALARGYAQAMSAEIGVPVVVLEHPYGCSQLGGDLEHTVKILSALARHPNAGGVLVLGLGCENLGIDLIRDRVPETERVRYLVAQEADDAQVNAVLRELHARIQADQREDVPLAALSVGLKCGGSDGFSGLTANPLVGCVTDMLIAAGASAVLSEVPEMFGAEHVLMKRARDTVVREKVMSLIDGFKRYYLDHGQPVSENPSPGNKAGGITTLEEKSLGCVRKGGSAPIMDVIGYGERLVTPGLNLLEAPGNDLVSSTALAAAGCQLILFTTGRGTPFGTIVPTCKISATSALAQRKPDWIDFDAGRLMAGEDWQTLSRELLARVVAIAGGMPTRNEINQYRDIAIFKTGVIL